METEDVMFCKQKWFGGHVTREFSEEPQSREQYLGEVAGKSGEQCHRSESRGRREALTSAQGHHQLSLPQNPPPAVRTL